MTITLSIEFIINISCISVEGQIKNEASDFPYIKDIFSKHYKEISAVFSLFIIFFAFFIFSFLNYCINCFDFLNEWDFLISIISFILCQLLYFIECLIIPVYLKRTKFLYLTDSIIIEDSINKIKKKYTSLTVVCFLFLFIIVLLDLILLNLHKGICCNMEKICNQTKDCCDNFGRCFLEQLTCLFGKKEKTEAIRKLEERTNQKDIEIYNLTGNIRSLMAENIEIVLKKSNI